MKIPYAARVSFRLGLVFGLFLIGSLRSANAEVVTVTVTARQMLDVDSGQIISDPYIRIDNGIITQVRKRNS